MTPAKCPNPVCPFLFDPSQVPPGAVIACPRCGLRFTLGPQPAPAPAFAAPTRPPADDLGLVEEPSNSDETPTEERPRGRNRNRTESTSEKKSKSPGRAAGSGAGMMILYSVIGVVVVCGTIAGVLYLKSLNAKVQVEGTTVKKEVVLDTYKIAYLPPSQGTWEANDQVKQKFKANVLAISSQDPVGWIVVDVKQMAYTPTAAELHDMVKAVLAVNCGDLKDHLDEEPATLGGVAGKRFTFESIFTLTGDDVKGEVYAVGFQKMAYFVYSFAPEKKVGDVAQTFSDFRAGIRFTTPPATTKPEQAGFSKSYRSKMGGYSLTSTENIWRERNDPASQDAKANLWITGNITVSSTGIRPDSANVLVLTLEKGAGDARATAEQYFQKTLFDLPDNPPTLKEVTDDLQGDDPASGPPNPVATVVRYELTYANGNASSRKFLTVSMLEDSKKLHVVVGYCVLRDRRTWEKRLVQLVGSLTAE